MALNFVLFVEFFLITCLLIEADIQIKCYECSRGNKVKLGLLRKEFSTPSDASTKRAINNYNKDCGSGTSLDSQFVTECINKRCQISYVLHDPALTVISSCQSIESNGPLTKGKYVMRTCTDNLCNNNAEGQDDKEDSGVSIQVNLFILICSSILLIAY